MAYGKKKILNRKMLILICKLNKIKCMLFRKKLIRKARKKNSLKKSNLMQIFKNLIWFSNKIIVRCVLIKKIIIKIQSKLLKKKIRLNKTKMNYKIY